MHSVGRHADMQTERCMDEWFNRHSAGMLVHMKPPLYIRYISYEICLCTSGLNDLCSWQSLVEPNIVVTLIKKL